MHPRRARALLLLLPLALVAAGCSSDDDASSPTEAPEATGPEASDPEGSTDGADDPAYQELGPNEVGTITLALDDGRRVVAWYPADESAADQPMQNFDIASLLAPGLQEAIDPELRPQYEIDAHVGAEPAADGPYPLVLFSHGFAGYPEQSASLVTHLASWGFVVVAPDHVERSLSGLLGTASQGVEERADSDVLMASLDLALADGERDGSPLAGLLDEEQVAVVGHSAGAGASYVTAGSEDRIDTFIAYSIGSGRSADGEEAPERPVPQMPGMVMIGMDDETIPASASQEVFAGMAEPKVQVEIADAGHLVFSDICLIGREQGGLTGLVEAAGLPIPENLLRLANDGCQEDALDPADAFDAINHLSVAFLRSTFGIDDEPVGLDQETADRFETAEITVTSEP